MSIVVLLLARLAAGLVVTREESVKPSDHFAIIWAFEFAEGGELNVTINLDKTNPAMRLNNSLQYLLCLDEEVEMLRPARPEDICSGEVFSFLKCERQSNFGNGFGFQHTWNVARTESNWYRILQLNCHADAYQSKLDIRAVNPGGEHLSVSELPYKTLYLATSIMWGIFALVWTGNWFLYRKFNIKLQRLVTGVPLVHCFVALFQLMEWTTKSRTGVESPELKWAAFFLVCVAKGVFFGALLVIGKGWGITRGSLSAFDMRRIFVMTVMLIVANGIIAQYQGFLLFFLVVMYAPPFSWHHTA
jgi:hypothetical protein